MNFSSLLLKFRSGLAQIKFANDKYRLQFYWPHIGWNSYKFDIWFAAGTNFRTTYQPLTGYWGIGCHILGFGLGFDCQRKMIKYRCDYHMVKYGLNTSPFYLEFEAPDMKTAVVIALNKAKENERAYGTPYGQEQIKIDAIQLLEQWKIDWDNKTK